MHAGAGATKVGEAAGEAAAAAEPVQPATSGESAAGGLPAQVTAGEQKPVPGGLIAQAAACEQASKQASGASAAGAPDELGALQVLFDHGIAIGAPPSLAAALAPVGVQEAIARAQQTLASGAAVQQVAVQFGEAAPESGELKRKLAAVDVNQVGEDTSADEGQGSKHRAHGDEPDERVQLTQPKPGTGAAADQAASVPLPSAPPTSAPHTPVSSPDELLLGRRRRCVELLGLTPEVLVQTARAGGASDLAIEAAEAEGPGCVVRALTDMILRREDAQAAVAKQQQQLLQVQLLQQQQVDLLAKSAVEAEAAKLQLAQVQQQQQDAAKAAEQAAAASTLKLATLPLATQQLAAAGQPAAPPEPDAASAAATAPSPSVPPAASAGGTAPPVTVAAARDEYTPPIWPPWRVAIQARMARLQFAEGHDDAAGPAAPVGSHAKRAAKAAAQPNSLEAQIAATWPAINSHAVLQCSMSTDGVRFLLCPIEGCAAMLIGGYHTGRDDECRSQDLAKQSAETFLGDGARTLAAEAVLLRGFDILYPLQSGSCGKATGKCQGHCDECRLSMMLPEPLPSPRPGVTRISAPALAAAEQHAFTATYKVFMWVANSAAEALLWRRQARAINPRAEWVTHDELASMVNADGLPVASVNMKTIMAHVHGIDLKVGPALQAPALTERDGWLEAKELSQAGMRATLTNHEGEDYDELSMPDDLAAECLICGKWMPLCDEQRHASFDNCHLPNSGDTDVRLNISGFRVNAKQALRHDELECFTMSHSGQASLGDVTSDLVEVLEKDDVPVVLLDVPLLTQISQGLSQLKLDNVRPSRVILSDADKNGGRPLSLERRKSSEGSNHHSQFTPPLRSNIRAVAKIVAGKYHPVPENPKADDNLQRNLFRMLRGLEAFLIPLELAVEGFGILWNNTHPSCSRQTLELALELADNAISIARVAPNVCSVVGPVACGKTELLTQLYENNFVQKDGPPLVGDPVAHVLFEKREAFAPELAEFLRVSELHRETDAQAARDYGHAISHNIAHGGVPAVHEDVTAATLALQFKAAASGVTPNFEDAFVTERSPVCNICFAIVALAQGKLSLLQFRQLLFRFQCKGFVPGVAIFIDDGVETCKARATARASKDPTRSAEATVDSVYTDMVHAAHTLIFLGLKQTGMRCEVHRVCLPDLDDDNGDAYTAYLDDRLQPTIVAALLRQP